MFAFGKNAASVCSNTLNELHKDEKVLRKLLRIHAEVQQVWYYFLSPQKSAMLCFSGVFWCYAWMLPGAGLSGLSDFSGLRGLSGLGLYCLSGLSGLPCLLVSLASIVSLVSMVSLVVLVSLVSLVSLVFWLS